MSRQPARPGKVVRHPADAAKGNEADNMPSPVIRLAATNDTVAPRQALIATLTELAERLDTPHPFHKGEFVAWKPGLQKRKHPAYGEPAIVRDILPVPTFDPSENAAGSAYFQEPLTLIIGIYREDDLIELRVDGRRFEPLAAA
jgi:hypothetical protein